MNQNNNLLLYLCPSDLGYIQIDLDEDNKIIAAIFIDEKDKKRLLEQIEKRTLASKKSEQRIRKALDDYFYHKKDLPRELISTLIRGTEFQKSIWQVISKVNFGETITYTEMAKRAGRPSATRAAGTACGKNPLGLFIPCHRVVRKQGEDYGYSWGAQRKKWLLNFEMSE